MIQKNPNNYAGIVGFTTSNGLLLDLDSTTYKESKSIAEYYCKLYKLEGYLITRSSQFNYHIIFNRYLDWNQICSLLCKITWNFHYYKHGIKPRLTNWVLLQIVKGSCTLRIGPKGKKPKPKIQYVSGKTHHLIKDYQEYYSKVGEKEN